MNFRKKGPDSQNIWFLVVGRRNTGRIKTPPSSRLQHPSQERSVHGPVHVTSSMWKFGFGFDLERLNEAPETTEATRSSIYLYVFGKRPQRLLVCKFKQDRPVPSPWSVDEVDHVTENWMKQPYASSYLGVGIKNCQNRHEPFGRSLGDLSEVFENSFLEL